MTALVVTRIERELKLNHRISERDANILFATLKAQEQGISDLKESLSLMVVEFEGAAETHDQMSALRLARQRLAGGGAS